MKTITRAEALITIEYHSGPADFTFQNKPDLKKTQKDQ